MASPPIALFVWRVSPDLIPGCGTPGDSYRYFCANNNGPEEVSVPFQTPIPLGRGGVVAIGRERQAGLISVCIDNLQVSRKHVVIYSVAYDQNNNCPPMVYVRDCGSLSGAFVNGRPISSHSRNVQSGFLLGDTDTITIEPYWQLICHMPNWGTTDTLGSIHRQEARLFRSRYIISDQIIGHGGSGVIHLAFDRKREKQIACKILNLDQSSKAPWVAQRILESNLREVNTLAKIRHPGVLAFEYAFRSSHTIFLFTELATSGDLFSKIVASPRLSGSEVKFIMHQVVRTVEYIHNKLGLVHRDLKPENIFFASGPDTETRIILGDFGHAKAKSWGRMTSRVGTDRYQAPELRSGSNHKGHDKAVDIWAIGIVMLLAMIPDYGDAFAHVEISMLSQVQVDYHLSVAFHPSTARGLVDPRAQDFVQKCLMIDPASRMTASQAKTHAWLRVEDHVLARWENVRNSFWKPRHGITPSMEELPDVLENQQSRTAASLIGHQTQSTGLKRNAEDLQQGHASEESLHFPSKKAKKGQ